jgi:hypothetical protein
MKSLKELIEGGQYELAAYRLVYGAVRTQMQTPPPSTSAPSPSDILRRRAKMAPEEAESDG